MFKDFVNQCNSVEPIDQCQIYSNIVFSSIETPQIGILMTPACDITQENVDYYNFCAVLPFEIKMYAHIQEKYSFTKENFITSVIASQTKNNLIDLIDKFIGNQGIRQHWLGNIPGKQNYWYIDYQIVQSFNQTQMDTITNSKFAKLTSPYKESAYVNFGNYLGRVGLPGEFPERKTLAISIYESLKTPS